MSVYTTRIRFICETEYLKINPSATQDTLNDTLSVCQAVHNNIFNFSYPLNDALKTDFETRFLMHYYMQEIGQETVGLWKHFLAEKLNLISDTYNQLYKSVGLEYDILSPINYSEIENSSGNETENTSRNIENNSESNESSENMSDTTTNNQTNSIHKDFRTPQGQLQDFLDGKYMSGATNDVSTDNNSTIVNSNGSDINETNSEQNESEDRNRNKTETRARHVQGKNDNVSQASLIAEYRQTVFNIIEQLIGEFEDLFMLTYDNDMWSVQNDMIVGRIFNG